MRVKNRKTGKWVELPDPEPTYREVRDMANRKLISTASMRVHDNMPSGYRKETHERGY